MEIFHNNIPEAPSLLVKTPIDMRLSQVPVLLEKWQALRGERVTMSDICLTHLYASFPSSAASQCSRIAYCCYSSPLDSDSTNANMTYNILASRSSANAWGELQRQPRRRLVGM